MSELLEQVILVAAGAAWQRGPVGVLLGLQPFMWAINTLSLVPEYRPAMVAGIEMGLAVDYRRERLAYS